MTIGTPTVIVTALPTLRGREGLFPGCAPLGRPTYAFVPDFEDRYDRPSQRHPQRRFRACREPVGAP